MSAVFHQDELDAGQAGRLRYGAAQRAIVQGKVSAAVDLIRAEIAASRDPATGAIRYPRNKGRVSFAEVCRRASVDKNTVALRDYHQELKRRIEAFVIEVSVELGAPRRRTAPVTEPNDATRCTRAAYAALAEELQLARRELAFRDARIRQLEAACLDQTRIRRRR